MTVGSKAPVGALNSFDDGPRHHATGKQLGALKVHFGREVELMGEPHGLQLLAVILAECEAGMTDAFEQVLRQKA